MVCTIVPSPHCTIAPSQQSTSANGMYHRAISPGFFRLPCFSFFMNFPTLALFKSKQTLKLTAWGIWTFLVFYAFSEFNQVCVWVVNIVSDIQMTFSPQQKMAGATLTPRHPLLHFPSRDKSRVTFEKMPLLKTFHNPEHSYKCTQFRTRHVLDFQVNGVSCCF